MRCQDSPKHPPKPGTAAPLDAETAAAAPSPDVTGEESTQPTGPDLPPLYDGWELDEQLRHLERVLAMDGGVAGTSGHAVKNAAGQRRFDTPHAAIPGWHVPEAEKRVKTRRRRRGSWTHAIVWLFLTLGLMALAFGSVLLGWSLVADRPELWRIGVPAALAGQVVLLLGLIVQLDRLWHDSRAASARLARVDERLARLGSRRTFHRDWRHGGAGDPQMVLSDIQRRLDVLAERIGEPEAK